jgi:methylmalonyl-CoA mutase cobalamin-binding domain/chain
MDAAATRLEVMEAILGGDPYGADQLLSAYAASGSFRQTMDDVLEPVLEEIGNRWVEENISLAQGYVAGKVAEELLLKLFEEEKAGSGKSRDRGSVVIGNIEDDYHSLGRKLVSIFLLSAGWQVHDLGSDVAADEFVRRAEETGSRIIGVSAMMYTTAANIRKVREELDRRGLSGKIMLAVGGAVFKLRPELCAEVGGDGTAANGFQVSQLFIELLEKSVSRVPQ